MGARIDLGTKRYLHKHIQVNVLDDRVHHTNFAYSGWLFLREAHLGPHRIPKRAPNAPEAQEGAVGWPQCTIVATDGAFLGFGGGPAGPRGAIGAGPRGVAGAPRAMRGSLGTCSAPWVHLEDPRQLLKPMK
ncbi:unnamed protein product, partial [Prorocentrum cordatum]